MLGLTWFEMKIDKGHDLYQSIFCWSFCVCISFLATFFHQADVPDKPYDNVLTPCVFVSDRDYVILTRSAPRWKVL